MSRLWTKVADRLSPGPQWRLGVNIGRDAIEVAKIKSMQGKWQLEWVKRQPISPMQFGGAPADTLLAGLAAAIENTCSGIRGSAVRVHLALPDPMGVFRTFELEQVPRSHQARLDLVRWRFAEELGKEPAGLACTYQRMGHSRDRHFLFAIAIDSGWFENIADAFRRNGIILSATDMRICYRFNRYRHILTQGNCGAALVGLDNDSWSLMIWDENGCPMVTRARWRTANQEKGSPGEYRRISSEIDRTVRAYVNSASVRPVGQFYLAEADEVPEDFIVAMNRRIKGKIVPLTTYEGINVRENRDVKEEGLSIGAITSAIGR